MGFLAWIKNGIKGTYGLQMPAFFPASRTTYDNSQSGLAATRVQGAIDEVNEKVDGKVLASVTADGVKTYSQLLDELFAAVSSVGLISKHAKITIGTHILGISCLNTANGYAIFSSSEYEEAYITMQSFRNVVLRSSGSRFTIYRVDNVNTTPTQSYIDVSSNVPSSGAVYTLYK